MIIPEIDPLTKPYWDGTKSRSLRLQHCLSCSHTWHPPAPACSACGKVEIEWREASGLGHVHSHIVVHETPEAAFESRLPLVIALVRLDEGPLMIANILDCPPEQVFVDMPVELEWEQIAEDIVLPQFKPRPKGSPSGE